MFGRVSRSSSGSPPNTRDAYHPAVDATQIADVLSHSPVFAPLGQRERLELAARMRSKHFQRNEVIFHRDDPAGHVYLIASGTVKVSVPEEGGQEVVIALHRGGDVFGEISLFDEGPRSATVTAMTETTTFALANRDFMDVLRGSPDAMRQLLALLATRIRRSTGHIEDLVFLDLPGRVAKLLIDQNELLGLDERDPADAGGSGSVRRRDARRGEPRARRSRAPWRGEARTRTGGDRRPGAAQERDPVLETSGPFGPLVLPSCREMRRGVMLCPPSSVACSAVVVRDARRARGHVAADVACAFRSRLRGRGRIRRRRPTFAEV